MLVGVAAAVELLTQAGIHRVQATQLSLTGMVIAPIDAWLRASRGLSVALSTRPHAEAAETACMSGAADRMSGHARSRSRHHVGSQRQFRSQRQLQRVHKGVRAANSAWRDASLHSRRAIP